MFFLLGVVLCVVLQIFNNVRALFFREYVKNWNLFNSQEWDHMPKHCLPAMHLHTCNLFAFVSYTPSPLFLFPNAATDPPLYFSFFWNLHWQFTSVWHIHSLLIWLRMLMSDLVALPGDSRGSIPRRSWTSRSHQVARTSRSSVERTALGSWTGLPARSKFLRGW